MKRDAREGLTFDGHPVQLACSPSPARAWVFRPLSNHSKKSWETSHCLHFVWNEHLSTFSLWSSAIPFMHNAQECWIQVGRILQHDNTLNSTITDSHVVSLLHWAFVAFSKLDHVFFRFVDEVVQFGDIQPLMEARETKCSITWKLWSQKFLAFLRKITRLHKGKCF